MRDIRVLFDVGFFDAKRYRVKDPDGRQPDTLVWRLRLEPPAVAVTRPDQLIAIGSALLAQGLEWEKELSDA